MDLGGPVLIQESNRVVGSLVFASGAFFQKSFCLAVDEVILPSPPIQVADAFLLLVAFHSTPFDFDRQSVHTVSDFLKVRTNKRRMYRGWNHTYFVAKHDGSTISSTAPQWLLSERNHWCLSQMFTSQVVHSNPNDDGHLHKMSANIMYAISSLIQRKRILLLLLRYRRLLFLSLRPQAWQLYYRKQMQNIGGINNWNSSAYSSIKFLTLFIKWCSIWDRLGGIW